MNGPASFAHLGAWLLLAAMVPIYAQTGSPAPPIIKTEVRQVLVPLVVTDKAGHYVADLGPADFSVFEDGVLQKIVAFNRTSISSHSERQFPSPNGHETAPTTAQESPKRTYLICLDTLHSAFENFAQVRQALAKFFAEEQAGDSQYALMALGWQLHVVVDSTRDPSVILSAIDSKELLKTIQDSEASNTATETREFSRLVGKWCHSCECANQRLDLAQPGCPGWKAQIQGSLLSFSERRLALDENFLQQLNQLVDAMASMPTKRTVLFISDGFNRLPGQELYNIVRNVSNDPNFKFNPHDLQPRLNAILRVAVREDIRFYTIDSRGLYTPLDSTGSPMDMNIAYTNGDAMAQLARDTGGAFFENNNDLLQGIRRAFADGREEYVLAYVSTKRNLDSNFRRILVAVKGKSLKVAAKSGYWAVP